MLLSKIAGARIRYTMPNAKREYDEAGRYLELKNLTVQQWELLVSTGRPVEITPEFLASIGNSTAIDQATATRDFPELEAEKRTRVTQQLKSGSIEMPIVLKNGDTYDLLSGNTRLTALVKAGISPTVLVVDITNSKAVNP